MKNMRFQSYNGVQCDLYIKCCSCRLIETQRAPLVEQKMLTPPQHISSSPLIFSFLSSVSYVIVWLLVLVICPSFDLLVAPLAFSPYQSIDLFI